MRDNVVILNRTPEDWERYLKNFLSKGGRVAQLIIVLVIILLFYMAKPFFTVGPGEKGVVLRLGKHVRTADSGLNLKLPWPIEKVITLNVLEIRRIALGYQEDGGQYSTMGRAKTPLPEESLMLTGDENIIQVELSVQYQIKDPAAFLFNVNDPDGTLRDICEASLRRVIGDYGVDAALTEGKAEIALEIERLTQELADEYNLGIELTAVQLEDVEPPEAVQASFKAVTTSKENKQKYINEGEGYRNGKIPAAEGRAVALLNDASGYARQRITKAEGDIIRFSAILQEYKKAPEITRQRLYYETMEEVLGETPLTLLDSRLSSVLPFLDIRKKDIAPTEQPQPIPEVTVPEVTP
jgi:membrane protease subunit HflK